MINSKSESYASAGVDITAGYKAVELMKAHIAKQSQRVALTTSAASEVSSSLI